MGKGWLPRPWCCPECGVDYWRGREDWDTCLKCTLLDLPTLPDHERVDLLLARRELVETGLATWDVEAVQLTLVDDGEEYPRD
jgi:hypothetical protein